MSLSHDKSGLWKKLIGDPSTPTLFSVWRHYKGGLYVVLAVGCDELDGTPRVCYRSNLHGTVQFRTLENWRDVVDHGGTLMPRFTPVRE